MSYLFFLLFICLVLVLMWVASSPSPYFGASGLMLSSMIGCGVLVGLGFSFVSLVLFLIYLGGMLVVFVYTVSLAADPFPEAVLGGIGVRFLGYLSLFIFVGLFVVLEWGSVVYGFGVGGVLGQCLVEVDFLGVSLLYFCGGFDLLVCGWVLLLVLFVVLELTRGLVRSSLRPLG